MTKFKIGDRVICNRPVETMRAYKGVTATVTGISPSRGLLGLSYPYEKCGVYTPEQFDKLNLVLENK